MTTSGTAPVVIQQPAPQSKTIEIFRIFAWPLLVLIIVLLFWAPLHGLINSLPDMISNSETVTVGKLSLRVGRYISDQANQEVREALSGMTSEDVSTVLENDIGSEPTLYTGGLFRDYANQWDRLGRLGVVHVLTEQELKKESKRNSATEEYIYGVTATAKYDKVRKFLFSIVNEAVLGGVHSSNAQESNH